MSDATAPNLPEIEPASAIPPAELDQITEGLVAALKTVYDPEIPVDIYELGLIYKIEIDDSKFVAIDMTLTAPGCPVAGEMPGWVETAAAGVPGRCRRQGVDGLRSAVGPEPHVGRGSRCPRYVVMANLLSFGGRKWLTQSSRM